MAGFPDTRNVFYEIFCVQVKTIVVLGEADKLRMYHTYTFQHGGIL